MEAEECLYLVAKELASTPGQKYSHSISGQSIAQVSPLEWLSHGLVVVTDEREDVGLHTPDQTMLETWR